MLAINVRCYYWWWYHIHKNMQKEVSEVGQKRKTMCMNENNKIPDRYTTVNCNLNYVFINAHNLHLHSAYFSWSEHFWLDFVPQPNCGKPNDVKLSVNVFPGDQGSNFCMSPMSISVIWIFLSECKNCMSFFNLYRDTGMDFPVDVLKGTSHGSLKCSADRYSNELLYSDPDYADYFTLPNAEKVKLILTITFRT